MTEARQGAWEEQVVEQQPPPEQDPKRAEYVEERRALVDAEREASQSFDKFMVTLSAGAFGLSITFVRELVNNPQSLWLLRSAWGAFGLSLCAILASFLLSQAALRRQRAILDEIEQGQEDAREKKNMPATITNLLNWISIALFVCGATALVAFAVTNYSP